MENTLKILKILATLAELREDARQAVLCSIMKGNTEDRIYLETDEYGRDRGVNFKVLDSVIEVEEFYERND